MPSFETGVRLLKNILIKKRSYSAFFADETDALHKAFPANVNFQRFSTPYPEVA